MGQHSLHSIVVRQAVLLVVVALCATAGCWEEIEYTGPDPSKVARRQSPPPADAEPAGSAADNSGPQPSPPPVEPRPPAAAEAEDLTASSPAEDFDEPEKAEEDLTSEDILIDDLEPEEMPVADIETTTTLSPPEPEPPVPALSTRRAAWQLGSKLTLAALAHDRGLVPNEVAKWLAEARSAAEMLGTSIAELPEPAAATEGDGGSRRVHDYLFQQGQRIWRELADRHGGNHASLFEVAVKSNVLLVLYEPGSSWGDMLAGSIREAAPAADLPAELWQPLLDTLAKQAPAAEVRTAVRRMHANIEQYLTATAEQ
jgi:hypothetical protein